MSKEKNSEKKASVERRVQRTRMVVKMNQPWIWLANIRRKN